MYDTEIRVHELSSDLAIVQQITTRVIRKKGREFIYSPEEDCEVVSGSLQDAIASAREGLE